MTTAATSASTKGRKPRTDPLVSSIWALLTPAADIQVFDSSEYHSAPSIQAATAAISTAQ